MKTTNFNLLRDLLTNLVNESEEAKIENNSELGIVLNERFGFRNVVQLNNFFTPYFIGELNITKVYDSEKELDSYVDVLIKRTPENGGQDYTINKYNNQGQECLKSWVSDCKKFEFLEYFGQEKTNPGYSGFKSIYVYINN